MMAQTQDSARLCLLLGTETVPEWFARALEIATTNTNVTISLVIQADKPDGGGEFDLITDIRQKKSWVLIAGLQKLSDTLLEPPTYNVNRKIKNIPSLKDVPVHRTSVETSGEYGYKFSDTDVAIIKEKADVAVHFGIGILHGDVLEAPKWGVIGYHHGNIGNYRGGPPGLWEFIHGRSNTGVTLQQFSETLDGGGILAFKEVPINDAGTWREVRDRQCTAAEPMLEQAINNLCDSEFEPESPDELGSVYSTSQRDWRVTVRYIYRELIGRSKNLLSA